MAKKKKCDCCGKETAALEKTRDGNLCEDCCDNAEYYP